MTAGDWKEASRHQVGVIPLTVTPVNRDRADITDQLQSMHWALGAHLARCRTAAGISQRRLGRALGYTSRTMVSKIEHGTRSMPASLWQIADELCHAKGALVAEYATLAQAEHDSSPQAPEASSRPHRT